MQHNVTFRKKDKGWQFIISYKVDRKWVQKSKQGFKLQKDAKLAADKMLDELKKNSTDYINIDNDLTLKELYEIFIKDVKLYRSQNTIEGYTYAYNKISDLKDLKVKNINKTILQQQVEYMILDKKNIKNSSIEAYIKKIKQIFKYFKDNFYSEYKLPTEGLKLNKKLDSTKRAMSKKEVDFMVEDMRNSKFYPLVLLCVKCGLRRSEALAITWNDIDEVNMCINVTKQWKKLPGGTWGFGDTKNKKHRTVPISSSMLKDLNKIKLKSTTDIYNRVSLYTGLYVSQYMNKELKKYNITIHELRHTFATHLIANNVDFKTTAALIGDSVEQVLKTYSHVNDDMMNKAKFIISQIF